MPKPYPREIRADVVRVARRREPGVTVEQFAKDAGHESVTQWERLQRTVRQAGSHAALRDVDASELCQAGRRIRLLERRSTTALAGANMVLSLPEAYRSRCRSACAKLLSKRNRPF